MYAGQGIGRSSVDAMKAEAAAKYDASRITQASDVRPGAFGLAAVLANDIAVLASRVEALTDKLVGSFPNDTEAGQEILQSPGVFGALETTCEVARVQVHRMHDLLESIERRARDVSGPVATLPPREPMARRRALVDSIDTLFELHRNEGFTNDDLRDALRSKLRSMNEAEEDAA